MTSQPDLFAALAAPFDPNEVKMRTQNSKLMHYITARTVMNRLDNVLGPENWWDRYVPGENSVLCELTIRLPDGSTLTKADAGGYAGMSDSGDDDKSGYSDAFKRAAVKFGVARYLYRDGVPTFVQDRTPAPVELNVTPPPPKASSESPRGQGPPYRANGNGHAKEHHEWETAKPHATATATPANGNGSMPRTGKQLFAWTKEQEQRHCVGLLKYLNGWAKLQEFPGRMVDWDADQVALAHAEAVRKLGAIESQETGE